MTCAGEVFYKAHEGMRAEGARARAEGTSGIHARFSLDRP